VATVDGPKPTWDEAVQGVVDRIRQHTETAVLAAADKYGRSWIDTLLNEFPLLGWSAEEAKKVTFEEALVSWWDWTEMQKYLQNLCSRCDNAQSPPCLGNERVGNYPSAKPPLYEVAWLPCQNYKRFVERRRADKVLGDSQLPRRFVGRTLGTLDVANRPALQRALKDSRRFVDSYQEDKEQKGLLLMGPAGTGKTHLAAGILAELAKQGVASRYFTVPDLLATLRDAIAKNEMDSILTGMRRVPVLVLDDLGKEYLRDAQGSYTTGGWAEEVLYRLINWRYEDCLPVIVTTNLDEQWLTERYGKALVSRLREMCNWHILNLPDYRAIKGGDSNVGSNGPVKG